MMKQRIIISQDLREELAMAISACEHDRIFILTDVLTHRHCWPLIHDFPSLKDAAVIEIHASDANKNLESLSQVWKALGDHGATRHSLLINLGGGMVTDLGGFAASTFKRGIDFINIPTTLLAMVDASVGGKTGINFNGLKNEIGVFNDSRFVMLDTRFLRTLDEENLLSGYAEMIKHGLISDHRRWADLLQFDITGREGMSDGHGNRSIDLKRLQSMVAESVSVKERIVAKDPHEKDIRKALNLGHTFGHAFESLSLRRAALKTDDRQPQKPILHGFAVAYGLVCELYLSAVKTGFPTEKLRQTVSFIHEHYGKFYFTCDDYDAIIQLMQHDKKNRAGVINFTLLADVGDIRIDQTASTDEIRNALDFYREGE